MAVENVLQNVLKELSRLYKYLGLQDQSTAAPVAAAV